MPATKNSLHQIVFSPLQRLHVLSYYLTHDETIATMTAHTLKKFTEITFVRQTTGSYI